MTPTSGTNDPAVKVLLVEDDEDDVVLTRELLREIGGDGFVLDWEPGYDAALARLCTQRYDVCLVDYRLGEKDGVELVREALGRGCGVPVILLTSQADKQVDLAAMRAGAADFLNKSQITADLLERSIRYAIQQKKAEEQRVRLVEEQGRRFQAEAASRAKDAFLAQLSHELRTPLMPALMAVAALERDPDLPEKYREDIEMVRRNVELEAKLIDDLLDLTRITRGKLELHHEIVDVHGLLSHIVKSCQDGEMLKERQRLRSELSARQHHVWGDPARLQQVFWNLVRNAVKFTPAGGTISIRTADEGPAEPRLLIEVSDTGIGIEPQVLPRIFDAFEQGAATITRQYGGLGLGLAICKALVGLHGGSIRSASAGKDRGATFTVELDTVAAPTMKRHPSQPTAPAAETGRPLSILLVEDHESTSRLMARLLSGRSHDVSTAADVASAKQLADSRPFHLVISDLGLPDGSGLDLMRHLADKYGLTGIALSGYGMEEDIRQSHEAGFAVHLVKPVNFDQLEAAIERVAPRLAGPASVPAGVDVGKS